MTKKDKNGLLIAGGVAAIILIVWLSKKVKSDEGRGLPVSEKPLEEMTDQELRELLMQLDTELCIMRPAVIMNRDQTILAINENREGKAIGATNCPTPEQEKCALELQSAMKGLDFDDKGPLSDRAGMRMICPHSNEGHTMTMHPTLRKRLEKLGWEYDDWLPSGKPKIPRTQSFCNAN